MAEVGNDIAPRRIDRLEQSIELDPYWNKEKGAYVKKDSLPAVAVSGKYDDLKGKPAVDSEPTEDSSNLVASGGVFSALKKKANLDNNGTVPASELPKASADGSVAGIVNLRRHNGKNYSGLNVVGEGLWVNCKNGGGLSITGSGELLASITGAASSDDITNHTSTTKALTPSNLADIKNAIVPAVVAPSSSATEGQVADAKKTSDRLDTLSEQIDTESPLLARSFTIEQQSGWNLEQGNGSALYFRPRFFGMNNGDLFKGIIIRTKSSNLTPFDTVYMRVKRYSDGAVVGISNPVVWPNTTNTDVAFTLPVAVTLPSKDNYYIIEFAQTADGTAIPQFGIKIYVLTSGTNADCYFQASTYVPVMTAQFYSFAAVVAPSSYATAGQLADARATYEAIQNASEISNSKYTINSSWNGSTPPGGNTVSKCSLSAASASLNIAASETFTSGNVLDFVIDIENADGVQATVDFTGLGSDWYAVVNDGEDLSDMTTLAAGEMARFYFTQTAFTKNSKPVIQIAKQVVTDASAGGGSYQIETDGTVTTDGELNSDGTLSVEGEPSSDGTFTVEAI